MSKDGYPPAVQPQVTTVNGFYALDLHFTDHKPIDAEMTAVDLFLGTVESQERVGRITRQRRHLLLPVLHAIQKQIGWISPGALNYLCERLTIPPAEAYGVATFYALLSTTPQPPTVVHVCDDIACKTRGADKLCADLESGVQPNGQFAWKRTPCLGLCDQAPAALVQRTGADDYTIAPTTAGSILSLLHDTRSVEESAQSAPTKAPSLRRSGSGEVPAIAPAFRPGSQCLLARIGVVDPASLDDYRANEGYVALRRALELGPADIIRELSDAQLTGRGGAAFPTSVKWKAVAEAPERPHYVVCNADESEPGTFKDRVLMEGDPFAVIESMTIAGFACGAERGYLYIRGEYPEATGLLQNAIDQARNHGLLGEDIMGRGFTFDIEIRRGAGAYICGEETALLESIEGKRGEPRNKPPFPVRVGLFGKPTAINNVETLVNVLPILLGGGAAYAETGNERSTGTRLFCLSGCVERPGVYELEYGATLGEALTLAGGVRGGRPLQAILLGGAAGVFVRPDELDIPLTLEGARAAKAALGSGVILVFDDTIDLMGILARIAAFFRDESCGQCVPCRVGTVRQEEALHRLLAADSRKDEIELLDELDRAMRDASICGLGQTAGSAISSAIHRLGLFQEESA